MEDFADFQMEDFPLFSDLESQKEQDFFEEYTYNNKKGFRCTFPDCGKIFRYKSEIMKHSVSHVNNRPFTCPHEGCDKSFKRSDALQNHIRIHTKQVPFECEWPNCGLKFPTKAALRYHILKHNDQKAYKCSFAGCDKTFLTLAQLKKHEKSLNYHQKISALTGPQKIPEVSHEFVTYMPEPEKKIWTEFSIPAPRPATNIQWEVRNPVELEEKTGEKAQKKFETVIESILDENKALKKKLSLYQQVMEMLQENNRLKDQLNKTMMFEPTDKKLQTDIEAPMNSFTTGELSLLEFLREQDQ